MIPVFDSWAMLALLRGEPAAERIQPYFDRGDAVMSVMNYTEVLYRLMRLFGIDRADTFSNEVIAPTSKVEILIAGPRQARRAAAIKAVGGLSLADAFAAALAIDKEGILLTGDPELRLASQRWGFALEWLGT